MIEFQNVSKKYNGSETEVVKNLSFVVPEKSIVALIGPSGCGKTTTLKMINRLIGVSEGRILIDGNDIMNSDPIELRRSMGYVIQQTGLFPHLTIKENVEIISRVGEKDLKAITERTYEVMKMVGLDESYLDRYPTQLSGGQLQRVGVARAFARDPEIVLMDEPFSALDPITRVQLQDELIFLQERLKKTIVFVTHDMDEAVKLADMICIMNNGHIIQYDTPENIMKNPANDYVMNFVGRNRIWSNPQYIFAKDFMISDPVFVPEGLNCLKAMEQMRLKNSNFSLVVTDEKKLLGIVSAQDVQSLQDKSTPVKTLMKEPEATTHEYDTMVDLLKKINVNKASCCPVISERGIVVGVINSSSLVTTLSQQYLN